MGATATHIRSTWNATIRTILGGALVVSLVLLAFVWPAATSNVHNLPVAVVGSGAPADTVRSKLADSGNFRLSEQQDRAGAVDAIERRQLYGAVVMPHDAGDKIEVLTSSAASPVVAQMLTGMGAQLGQNAAQQAGAAKQQAAQSAGEAGAQAAAAQSALATLQATQAKLPEADRALLQGDVAQAQARAQAAGERAAGAKQAAEAISAPSISVTDVVPLSADDPRGTGLALAALPIAMGGMLGGLLISLLLVGVGRRLTAVAGYSLLGAAGMTGIMHGLFHLLPGSWWHTAGIFALALAATSATIVGLNSAIGKAGIPIGAIVTMFVGNPLASASAPVEFMPWHWGGIGQWFVPGAASTLLRLTSYFPKASMTAPLLVLAGWVAAGVLLSVFGHFRSQEVIHLEGYTELDEPRHAHADSTDVEDTAPARRSAGEAAATREAPQPGSATA